jgi:SAM-dependent methyltransferase
VYTAQAAGGLLAVAELLPAAVDAAARACRYLASRIEPCGRIVPEPTSTAPDAWCEAARLGSLPPLAEAARRLGLPAWQLACRRAISWHARRMHLWSGAAPMLWRATAAAALAELEEAELAAEALRYTPIPARRNGTCPENHRSRQILLATQAILARARFQLGELDAGNRLLEWIARQQLAAGGLPHAVGTHRTGAAARPDFHSTTCYLLARRLQVAAHFAKHGHALPQAISPHDGRLQHVLAWARRLGPRARIAEVGCGPGRYLAQLRAALPDARLVGIDPDTRWISRLPAGVEGRTGDLLRIPASAGEFDGVLAIESLEHCLVPEHAVRELCRVVRPGGSVLIIDKHAGHQPLSQHEPWERWFWPREVAAWLGACGCDVQVSYVAHGPYHSPTGLFVAWQATRRAAVARAA